MFVFVGIKIDAQVKSSNGKCISFWKVDLFGFTYTYQNVCVELRVF